MLPFWVVIELGATTEGTGLDARAVLDGQTIAVTLAGTAEMAAVDPLRTICERLHATALEQRIREVRVDLTNLEFMSSSCFKCLVTWIGEIRDLDPAAQYKLHLRSSAAHLWQRRSLHVLQTFATELVTIES